MKKLLLVAFVLFASCRHEHRNSNFEWSPANKAAIREGWMLSSPIPKTEADRALKEKMCDCLISRFEQAFPDGMPKKPSKAVTVKIEADCMQKGR
jgi:hypothetical protein